VVHECEREGDISTILRLFFEIRELQSISMRIFLTSRPGLPIRLGFKNMSADAHQDMMLEEISAGTIKHDISVYLKDEFARIKTEYNTLHFPGFGLPVDWLGDERIERLASMAVPLFIFAATVCRFVGDSRWNPKRRHDTVLEYETASQASNLDWTYLPILQQLIKGCTNLEKKSLAQEFRDISSGPLSLSPILYPHVPLPISLPISLTFPKRMSMTG
jgi:hypothetical protein